jgi:hypothetical protein
MSHAGDEWRLGRRQFLTLAASSLWSQRGRAPDASSARAALFPFVIPWDDASPGPVDLRAWNRPIQREADRLRAGSDGHLYRSGERVRLFGFDVSSGAALLEHACAGPVAAHLAKLGVNYVRIAQHSNPSPAGWLSRKTFTGLDPDARDRLDFFVAHLRRWGIYVHLVLTHFRRWYPPEVPGIQEGLPIPWGWPREGTGVTQFFTPVIRENRTLARELLRHRNPYTGQSFAEDPGIAIVEVTNEDGLLQTWHGGQLDTIIDGVSPHLDPLRDELQRRWNRWLRSRYGSGEALRAAWEEGVHPAGQELLDPNRPWQIRVHPDAQSRWQVLSTGGPGGSPVLRLEVERPGLAPWHVAALQAPFGVGPRPYLLQLWARAPRPGAQVGVLLQQARPPFHVLASLPSPLALGDTWHRYSAVLTPASEEMQAQLVVAAGGQEGVVELAGASLRESPRVGLHPGETPERGTVPPFPRRAVELRTLPAQQEWGRFLYETERQFFEGAFRFLREELGVRALLVGTQSTFSPPTIQAQGDATSVHAYWSHPVFPGRPWDPANWYVPNSSMTGARDQWNTLNRIAFRRWLDKPLVVDEYNHPQPNTFGAEGLPLLAAYGAFQDWDGIAGWTYREGSWEHWLREDDLDRPAIRNFFSLDTDPVKIVGAWLGAVIFRRGDLAPGQEVSLLRLSEEDDREIARTLGPWRAQEALAGGALSLPFSRRLALGSEGEAALPGSPGGRARVASDTGQLVWEVLGAGRGVVTVASPRAALVIGFARGREYALGDVVLVPGPTAQHGFGVWGVVALDGEVPIAHARRLVVVALGYSQNSGTRWAEYPDHLLPGLPPEGGQVTVGRAWGQPPVLAEGVPATVIVPLRGGTPTAWALDGAGQRVSRVPVRIDGSRALLEVGPAYRTLWYEVSREGR